MERITHPKPVIVAEFPVTAVSASGHPAEPNYPRNAMTTITTQPGPHDRRYTDIHSWLALAP